MRNLFSYFKKNEIKSQPLKRSQKDNLNIENHESKTCPLKKSNVDFTDFNKISLFTHFKHGDILIVESVFPAIFLSLNYDEFQGKCDSNSILEGENTNSKKFINIY